MAENFERNASAAVTPTSSVRQGVGRSSQSVKANRAATNVAVTGRSVVAKPAWARMGGSVVNNRTATTAAASPYSLRDQIHTH